MDNFVIYSVGGGEPTHMNFRRKEGFRFVFNDHVDARFVLFINGRQIQYETYPCKILDISPRGMKIYSEAAITHFLDSEMQFEVHFVLDVTPIKAVGQVVWSKPFGAGKHYGLCLNAQPHIDELIISEMKRRRRKEVFHK